MLMSHRDYDILTFDDLTTFYGGPDQMRERFGLSEPGVWHWKYRGVSKGYHLPIYLRARAEGKTISPDLFQADDETAGLMNQEVFKTARA